MQDFICILVPEPVKIRGGPTCNLSGSDTLASYPVYSYIHVISLLDSKVLEGKT